MKILVTNDDGINAPGILKLTELASRLGEVTVIAPSSQCSAMSQKLTIASKMYVEGVDFPVPVKAAYKVDGTPADCVKFGIYSILDTKPDIVFTGINAGFNSGTDIAYSGTVGAAMESLIEGVPAIAFSTGFTTNYDAIDKLLIPIVQELLNKEISDSEIWNVNIPDTNAELVRGILWDRTIGKKGYYDNLYTVESDSETGTIYGKKMLPSDAPEIGGRVLVGISAVPVDYLVDGTDVGALKSGYASVGKIRTILG